MSALRRGGYWENVGNFLTREGIVEANSAYAGSDLAKQYKRMKQKTKAGVLSKGGQIINLRLRTYTLFYQMMGLNEKQRTKEFVSFFLKFAFPSE